ncbi:hypothetical protein DMX11_06795 [Pseudomonas sp. LB-090624]|nr:hypothetical protein DMX11_06795 [Pseudomonas sp. LB-090624]
MKVVEEKPQAKEVPKVEAPALGAAVAKASPQSAGDATAQGGQKGPAPGAVVRALVKESPPPVPAQAAAAVAAKPVEKAKPEPAKVDQSFTFAPVMPITVHGDVKDSNQIVREASQTLRAMWGVFQREVETRQASIQLFDAAHII